MRSCLLPPLAGLLLLGGCAGVPGAAAPVACQGAACPPTKGYLIGPGDVLHVSVWKDATLDRTVTVRPDGMVSFPLLNDIQVNGFTPMELQKAMSAKLQQYVADPEVSVVVQEVHSFAVSVMGQVKNPGRYEQKEQVTVLDVLAEAGGFTAFASPSEIVVLRSEGTTRQRLTFDYNDAISKQGAQGVIFVHPGDVILVP